MIFHKLPYNMQLMQPKTRMYLLLWLQCWQLVSYRTRYKYAEENKIFKFHFISMTAFQVPMK